jgi:hypothetical protein
MTLSSTGKRRRRYLWTPQLDEMLEHGYRSGPDTLRMMIRKIQALTGWPRQACWDRARKLGIAKKRTSEMRRWTKPEEDHLIQYAGSRNVRHLARQLKRTEKSVREKLATMKIDNRTGISARVSDGHTKMELAQYLGRSPKTIQRWIDWGWLKGRYEGKQREDDTLRITDEDFRTFWRKHPTEAPFHSLSVEGLEWFLSVMVDIPMNQVMGDPLARHERRQQRKQTRQADPIAYDQIQSGNQQ